MSEHLLEIKDLRTSFNIPSGEVRSVNGVTFSVDKNEVVGIVGESGSGKSVTAYSIMQILDKPGRIVGGSIKFNGQELLNIPSHQIQKIRGGKIAIVFQDAMTSLNPVWSIGNQLKECIKSHPETPSYKKLKDRIVSLKKQIKKGNKNIDQLKVQLKETKKEYKEFPTKQCLKMLKLVGINEPEKRLKQYPYEFSGGMLQRVMIAMALICEPELIIADEPTTALDVTIQAQILDLLKTIQKKTGMGIIIITHDLGVVAQLCDKVNVMYAGRIVETGTCDDIFYNPKHEYTKGLITSIPKMQDKRNEKLIPIPGNPVDVFCLPSGCSFAPRCNKCMKICLKKYPNFLDVSLNHKTSCFAFLEELVKQNKIDEETYKKYLDGCQIENKSFKKISLFDVEEVRNSYKKAKENLKNADYSTISKNEYKILKYRVNERKNEYFRIKKDFKISIKNFFQSRSEKKSINKNDTKKKSIHIIHEFIVGSCTFNESEFNDYINNMVLSTTPINKEVTKEIVINSKKEYQNARKQHLINIFKNEIAVHDNYYNKKIEYYKLKDALKWKEYIEARRVSLTKKLAFILKIKRKGAN